jgi:hypothetical protein
MKLREILYKKSKKHSVRKRKYIRDSLNKRANLISDVNNAPEEMREAYIVLKRAGIYKDFSIGEEFLVGDIQYQVINHAMIQSSYNLLTTDELQKRREQNYGPPRFYKFEKYNYRPLIRVKQLNGKNAGNILLLEIDKLIDYRTNVAGNEEKKYRKIKKTEEPAKKSWLKKWL